MIDIIAHAIRVVILVGVGAGIGKAKLCEFFCANFFEAALVLALLVLLVEDAVLALVKSNASEAVFAANAVVTVGAIVAVFAVIAIIAVVAV